MGFHSLHLHFPFKLYLCIWYTLLCTSVHFHTHTKSAWFLEGHVTLKTGVMAAENSACITERNYILKDSKVEISFLKLKLYFTLLLFYCICSVDEHKRLLSKMFEWYLCMCVCVWGGSIKQWTFCFVFYLLIRVSFFLIWKIHTVVLSINCHSM